MNKTKRTLLMVSGILSLVEAGILLIFLFSLNTMLDSLFNSMQEIATSGQLPYEQLTEQELQFMKTFLTILVCVYAIFTTLAGIFTLSAISDPVKFQTRRGLYITGAVFTILSGPISVSSILFYISFAIKEQTPISNSTTAITQQPTNNYDDIERKIKLLRNLKEREEITQEEFRRRLTEMLDKDK